MPLSTRTLMMLMVVFWVHLSLLDNQRVLGLKCFLCGFDSTNQVSKPCDLDGTATVKEECDTDSALCIEQLVIFLDSKRPEWMKTCVTEGLRQASIKYGYSCHTFIYSEENTVKIKTKRCFCSTDLCNNHLSLTDPVTTTTAASQITTEVATSEAPSIITGCSRLLICSLATYFFVK